MVTADDWTIRNSKGEVIQTWISSEEAEAAQQTPTTQERRDLMTDCEAAATRAAEMLCQPDPRAWAVEVITAEYVAEIERALSAWLNYHSVDARLNRPDFELAAEAIRHRRTFIDRGDPAEGDSILDILTALIDGRDDA